MAIILNPYLNFKDNTEEVLNFYKGVFGGDFEITRFTDIPGVPPVAEEHKNLVMHSVLKNDHFQLMAADSAPMGGQGGKNGGISLSGDDSDKATLTKYFEGLSAGGEVTMPLETAPWGDTFGMVTDKFGVMWMVNITAPKS